MFRHDPEDTGNYNFAGVPPGAVSKARLRPVGAGRYRLSFTASGADGTCGTPSAYLLRVNGHAVRTRLGRPRRAGRRVSKVITLGRRARRLTIQARNASGVLGYPVTLTVPR
jgi:hypothetical protein